MASSLFSRGVRFRVITLNEEPPARDVSQLGLKTSALPSDAVIPWSCRSRFRQGLSHRSSSRHATSADGAGFPGRTGAWMRTPQRSAGGRCVRGWCSIGRPQRSEPGRETALNWCGENVLTSPRAMCLPSARDCFELFSIVGYASSALRMRMWRQSSMGLMSHTSPPGVKPARWPTCLP